MAFKSSLGWCARGRPPGLASGIRDLRISHSSSERSVGYGLRVDIKKRLLRDSGAASYYLKALLRHPLRGCLRSPNRLLDHASRDYTVPFHNHFLPFSHLRSSPCSPILTLLRHPLRTE